VQRKIIIAATSARAYAQAAVSCGDEVIALDAFADADLKKMASEVYQVKMLDFKLDVDDFKRKFEEINLESIAGFCYGSIFDAAPALLDWVATQLPIIGNKAEILKRAKAFGFFEMLADLHIPHPKVSRDLPEIADYWLSKAVGGSGGTHVKPAIQHVYGDYFQEEIIGDPVSMLFLANGKEIQLIGFNRQLISPTPTLPYRYAGAIGGVKLQDSVEQAFCNAAKLLTKELGLLGINSLDAVLCGETLSVLELNPRLSASFELYPKMWDAHIKACYGELIACPRINTARAKKTIFADTNIEIAENFAWPDWVADVPTMDLLGNKIEIESGSPICTLLAEADTAELAHIKLVERAKQLREMM
jgi:uncharacterized protein